MALAHLEERGYRDVLLVTEPFDGTSSRIERVASFKAHIAQRPALRGTLVETGSDLTAQLKAFLDTPDLAPKRCFAPTGSRRWPAPMRCVSSGATCLKTWPDCPG
jgi:LacI family kdg operon repressor